MPNIEYSNDYGEWRWGCGICEDRFKLFAHLAKHLNDWHKKLTHPTILVPEDY